MDLVKCSPKAEKTKQSCKTAVNYLLDNPNLIEEMRGSKQLPIKIIAASTNIPRKILERHRKYIIAAVEVLHGEYLGIAQYLNCLREGVRGQ
jgi:RNA polymerase sigma factor